MTAARQGRRILSKEKDRERRVERERVKARGANGGKGRRREREREKAILSYASSAPETHRVSFSLSLSRSCHSTFIFLLRPSRPASPLLAISSPFRDVCNRFERLERPREPTRASAFSVYHRLPSIFTIFTSRPRDPTAYNQTSRTEEKGTWDPLPTFPSIFAFFPPSLPPCAASTRCPTARHYRLFPSLSGCSFLNRENLNKYGA